MIGKQINIFGEEDDFNVSQNGKRVGLAYQGSKSRIAKIIVELLPSGNRFVDLFGGGGSMTHSAILSNKWKEFLYNDYDKIVCEYFEKAIRGEYKNETRVITREDFERLKDTDPYVRFAWSFGNKGGEYLWGKDIEEIKLLACRMIMDNDWHDRFRHYREWIRIVLKGVRDKRLELQSLGHIKCTNMSYQDYEYQDGDVVYCDPPYENTTRYNNQDFDSKAFYEWVKTRPYQVWFSSYEISDDSFYKEKIFSLQRIMSAQDQKSYANEYLYSNKKI